MKLTSWAARSALPLALAAAATSAEAQGVTSAGITVRVVDTSRAPMPDARVLAVHQPSGTRYEGRTHGNGRMSLRGMRVGGPYVVSATALGFEPAVKEGVFLTLGSQTDLELIVGGQDGGRETRRAIFSSDRTGSATSISGWVLRTLPTISGRMEDFLRLTPQFSGVSFGNSFAGQDTRMNEITVDGARFGDTFGMNGTPGQRSGIAPIALDAIEQIRVDVAPYDVRQSGFLGADVSAVTRSGANEYRGSVTFGGRDGRGLFHGGRAKSREVERGDFDYRKLSLLASGPVIRDRLFFFASVESDGIRRPATPFVANRGGLVVRNVSRVLASDLDDLSEFLRTNFNYETGPYEKYDLVSPANRYLGRLDYNLDGRNKIRLRYHLLDSYGDSMVTNTDALGVRNRHGTPNGLNFARSNFRVLEKIQSLALELNSTFAADAFNSLIAGYEHHDESRDYDGPLFPLVDILRDGTTYTTFGVDPFSAENELRYGGWHVRDDFTIRRGDHELTFGVGGEAYRSERRFYPGSQTVYVYDSLLDFYRDARGFLANPDRIAAPVTLRIFQKRWSNIPGEPSPVQRLDVFNAALYGQDRWVFGERLVFTLGLRIDRQSFAGTTRPNSEVDSLQFRDGAGPATFSTSTLPRAGLLVSPRAAFNWQPPADDALQVRGGSGVFTGRPAYVWISNQLAENGVLSRFERRSNTRTRPFHPDPSHYEPEVTGAPAASYPLALVDPDFRFPQVWRTDLAVDREMPWGLLGTGEVSLSRNLNAVHYINANLTASDRNFNGPDQRPRWAAVNRINADIENAVVLTNRNAGYSWSLAGSVEKEFGDQSFFKSGYSYGVSKNLVDPGTGAAQSWEGNAHSGDPNNPGVAFSEYSPGHRFFAATAIRRNLTRAGRTSIGLFWESASVGNGSYRYSGDLNRDGSSVNDLIYIPRNRSEMNFERYESGGRTFTVPQQEEAWERFILQDDYLSRHRGEYAQRNAVFLPMRHRLDLSLSQQLTGGWVGPRNGIEVRLDVLNVGNLLNSDWGVTRRLITTQPLIARGVDNDGEPLHRLRNIDGELISKSFEPSATASDVYRVLLSVRYSFN